MKLKRAPVLFVILLLLCSCGEKEKKTEGFTIKDDYGKDVRFDSIPKRIISLAPNITEALYALGADSMLAGVTTYCDYPPRAKDKQKVGGLVDPNYEVIASLKPDVVLMTVEGNLKTAYDALQNMGIKVFVTNPRDITGVEKMITSFGEITGKKEEASRLVNDMELNKNKLINERKEKPDDILFLISVNPLITSNKNSFTNQILELGGLNNIYKDEPIDYPSISYEDIIKRNPAFIVIPLDTANNVLKQTYMDELKGRLSSLDAVKNDRILFADANILFRPGPRVVNAANYLKNIVYSYKNR